MGTEDKKEPFRNGLRDSWMLVMVMMPMVMVMVMMMMVMVMVMTASRRK